MCVSMPVDCIADGIVRDSYVISMVSRPQGVPSNFHREIFSRKATAADGSDKGSQTLKKKEYNVIKY